VILTTGATLVVLGTDLCRRHRRRRRRRRRRATHTRARRYTHAHAHAYLRSNTRAHVDRT